MRRLVTSLEFIHQLHMVAFVVKSPYPGKALDGLRTLGNDQGVSVTRRREKTALAWYVWSGHILVVTAFRFRNHVGPKVVPTPKCLSCERGNNFFPYQMPPIESKQPPHPCLTKQQRILFQPTIFWEWCIDHVPLAHTGRGERQQVRSFRSSGKNFICAAHALRL